MYTSILAPNCIVMGAGPEQRQDITKSFVQKRYERIVMAMPVGYVGQANGNGRGLKYATRMRLGFARSKPGCHFSASGRGKGNKGELKQLFGGRALPRVF